MKKLTIILMILLLSTIATAERQSIDNANDIVSVTIEPWRCSNPIGICTYKITEQGQALGTTLRRIQSNHNIELIKLEKETTTIETTWKPLSCNRNVQQNENETWCTQTAITDENILGFVTKTIVTDYNKWKKRNTEIRFERNTFEEKLTNEKKERQNIELNQTQNEYNNTGDSTNGTGTYYLTIKSNQKKGKWDYFNGDLIVDPWWNNNWLMAFDINRGNPTGITDTNIIVQIDLNYENLPSDINDVFWTNTQSNGQDIRFTNGDQNEQLWHFQEYFNPTTRNARFYVRVTTYPATGVHLRLLFANPLATQDSNGFRS